MGKGFDKKELIAYLDLHLEVRKLAEVIEDVLDRIELFKDDPDFDLSTEIRIVEEALGAFLEKIEGKR